MEQKTFFGSFIKKLVIVILLTAIGTAAGWFISHQQKAVWRSSAQFDAPTISELNNYYNLATTYALVQNGNTENLATILVNKSFAELKRNLKSEDVAKNFVAQSERLKKEAEARGLSLGKTIDMFTKSLSFEDKSNTVHLVWDSADNAQQLLSDFVDFVTLQTRLTLNQELIDKWKVLFQQIKVATETNLGPIQAGSQVAQQDWNGKLNIMKSVQPLDNKLQAFRWLKKPELAASPYSPNAFSWALLGGILGLIISLFLISVVAISRRNR